MKRATAASLAFITVIALGATVGPAQAQQNGFQSAALTAGQPSGFDQQLASLQNEWARIKYQVAGEDSKLDAIHTLEEQADKLTATFPDRPEAMIWEGIILSTDAGIKKSMSGLPKVKKAKGLFEDALKIDPHALQGSAYTSLGSLYYQVPGWPISFGDNDKAEQNLKQALAINPDGIDANYFYGDFLLKDGRLDDAQTYLERALRAPDRPGRPLADAGRRQEIKAALAIVQEKVKNDDHSDYN